MTEWVWLREDVVLALHDEQLAEHGGAAGSRDHGLLQSALARPQNLRAYGEPDAVGLAAATLMGSRGTAHSWTETSARPQ